MGRAPCHNPAVLGLAFHFLVNLHASVPRSIGLGHASTIGIKGWFRCKPGLMCGVHAPGNYSLTALSCRDNFPVCVYEPAHQRCEALRHYFISWSCDCHTFVNPLRNAISVHVCLSSLSLNEMPSFL